MTTINGGKLLALALEESGTTDIFTLHGGHLDPFLVECADHGIRVTDTRHESTAGHAADAYARMTGRIGVCVTTSGPGFTNTFTAMANAKLDASPVLFIIGAPPLREQELNVLQGGLDQIEAARTVSKWAHRVTNGERIPELVALAIRHATDGQPGPVVLEIPIDVLARLVPEEWVRMPSFGPAARSAPPESAVVAAVDALASAERPVLVVGGGAVLSRCSKELIELAELASVPVFAPNKGDGLVPGSHPLWGGGATALLTLDIFGGGAPDLVLLVGCRQGMFTGGHGRLLANATVIQVDVDGAEIGRIHDVEIPIVADARETLAALATEIRQRGGVDGGDGSADRAGWIKSTTQARHFHGALFTDPTTASGRMHPYFAAKAINDAIPEDAIVILDGGEAPAWVDLFIAAERPHSILRLGYLGTLGVGQGFAIGAARAHPGRPIVLVTGDGSLAFHISEFDTMARHEIPVATIVFNNMSWGMSVHGQQIVSGERGVVASRLADSNYEMVATALGGDGERVEHVEDMAAAIGRALASEVPYCINAAVDPEVVHPITTAMLGDTTATDAIVVPYYENLPIA